MRAKSLLLGFFMAAVAVAASAQGAQGSDPWAVLKGVRQSLVEAGPTQAVFTQTYVPAGFTSGEKESGQIALALPDCLRWDYQDPYPKGFLLCGGVAHSWNSQDKTGRRYRVDRKNEPGLDLLLLGVDDLKNRYRATSAPAADGRVEVRLSPKGKLEELTDAAFLVDTASDRVVAISYHDREGNLTRFEITGYRNLPSQAQFSPPPGIRWEE